MKHCPDNKSTIRDNAADCLIEKLILDPLLVGTKHREKLADLIDKFKDEYGEVTSRQGRFSTTFRLWLPNQIRRESVGMQSISLTLLRCWESLPVWCCQRILGLARQKGTGKVKKGDHAKTGVNKTSKQVLIYLQHQMMHGVCIGLVSPQQVSCGMAMILHP
jgi:hypothetical protein